MKKLLLFLSILVSLTIYSQTFIKNLGINNIDDGVTGITKSDKGFIIAGYFDKSAYIAEIDNYGKILWKDVYHITNQKDLITDIKYKDGKILACGYGYYAGTGNFLEFYFKYDVKSKKFDWIKKSKLALKPSNIHILPNGNYLITGDEIMIDVFKVFMMEINPKNGKMLYYTSYMLSGNESASSSLIHDKKIYLGGRFALEKKLDKYRGSISKFDLNFNKIWSNYYLNKKEKFVRNYLIKLIEDDNELVSIFATNNHGITNYYTTCLSKQTLDGKILWAKEYILENYENIRIKDVKANKNGYYLFGVTENPKENLFLIHTDKKGKVLWSKIYGENYSDNLSTDQGNFLELTKEYIYIVAQSKNISNQNKYNSILIKLNLDGTSDKDCWGKDVKVKTIPFQEKLVQGKLNLSRSDSTFISNNLSFKKDEKIKDFKSSYYCYPKLAINDFDTIKNESNIYIDFKKNDVIPKGEKISFRLISKAKNGSIKIENNKIKYSQTNTNLCIVDSFQYEISSNLGKDTASIFVFINKDKPKTTNLVLPLNNILVLEADAINAKYFWNTKETNSKITINKYGKYTLETLKDNCLYKNIFNVEENPYSFKEVANTNITFMLDVSTSMNRENRLPVLKKALYKVLTFMRAEDKLSIINYSNNAKIIFNGVKATEIDNIKQKIDNLESQGNSNIKEGLKMAIKTINDNIAKDGNNRIIFTTDGDISNEKRTELITYIQKELPKEVSFSLFLFNEASLFKDQMEKVSNSVNGSLYIITPKNVEQVLLKEFKAVRKKN